MVLSNHDVVLLPFRALVLVRKGSGYTGRKDQKKGHEGLNLPKQSIPSTIMAEPTINKRRLIPILLNQCQSCRVLVFHSFISFFLFFINRLLSLCIAKKIGSRSEKKRVADMTGQRNDCFKNGGSTVLREALLLTPREV